ncbi:MAG: hypothetical protein RLZZ623_3783 [Actinomycetota bacterium]|jgi:lipoprotein-anchoring transpeptidase ErfK/SrfK
MRLALVGSALWLGAGPAAHATAPPAPPAPVTQIEHATPVEAAGSATRGTAVQVEATFPPPPVVPGDSLELPADSGSGRRVVYSKGAQRVWLLEADDTLYNTHRVSGRMDQPAYGTYAVYSRSPFTCSNAHSNICMRWMVRFAHSFRGDNIGFHEIPKRDGVPMETDAQIGQPLSGGCVRQLTADAIIMWEWAQLGTVVVVVP